MLILLTLFRGMIHVCADLERVLAMFGKPCRFRMASRYAHRLQMSVRLNLFYLTLLGKQHVWVFNAGIEHGESSLRVAQCLLAAFVKPQSHAGRYYPRLDT